MLKQYRRHVKSCPHRDSAYRHCTCPIWVDGHLRGERVRKSLDTRNWKHAEELVLEMSTRKNQEPPPTVAIACQRYLADAKGRNLRPETIRLYARCVNRISAAFGKKSIEAVSVQNLRELRESWKFSGLVMRKHIEIMRVFFQFCVESGWITSNPARGVKPPVVAQSPTMPFTDEEMEKILWAVELYSEKHPQVRHETVMKLRALILLMRYSGLRVSDAVGLKSEKLKDGKIFLYQAKTGTPVWIPLPNKLVRALQALDDCNGYFFYNGSASLKTATTDWQGKLRQVYLLSGVPKAHTHRFRDTFACSLLLAGVPITDVSILLGHVNTLITEKHYAPWIRARQERLEEIVKKTFA